ncbi:hypothetical protein DAPPUDRAFT_122357 [Daphnia pulex]|uniref:Uncharacterized protein n=1 Tax=Daphnia pulex TaxID=6669 RepID=E9I406_DAPPU|nr:hypothetical protein DAPPUDRAFT_122357 [Daphnia pulex]|eukprot:EFX61274.1 hypothetical protein DAPPUDRAFT_122357 [Daphnia pulex]
MVVESQSLHLLEKSHRIPPKELVLLLQLLDLCEDLLWHLAHLRQSPPQLLVLGPQLPVFSPRPEAHLVVPPQRPILLFNAAQPSKQFVVLAQLLVETAPEEEAVVLGGRAEVEGRDVDAFGVGGVGSGCVEQVGLGLERMSPPEVFDDLRVHASHLPQRLVVHVPLLRQVHDHLVNRLARVLKTGNGHGFVGRPGSGLSGLEVFGDGPFDLVAVLAGKAFEVGGVDVEMWSLEAVVLLIVVDDIGDLFLLVEAALVDGVLGEVGLDDVEFAEVASAVAVVADAVGLVVVVEVVPRQLAGSPVEVLGLLLACRVVVPAALRLQQPRVERAVQVGLPCISQLQLGLELGLGGRGGSVALGDGSHGGAGG